MYRKIVTLLTTLYSEEGNADDLVNCKNKSKQLLNNIRSEDNNSNNLNLSVRCMI